MNRRSLNLWLGLALVVLGVGALVVTFPPSPLLGTQMVLLGLAGCFLVASGVTDRVRWATLVGLGNVSIGLSLGVSGVETFLSESGTADTAYGVAVAIGGLTLAVIGVLYVVGHEAFDTEP